MTPTCGLNFKWNFALKHISALQLINWSYIISVLSYAAFILWGVIYKKHFVSIEGATAKTNHNGFKSQAVSYFREEYSYFMVDGDDLMKLSKCIYRNGKRVSTLWHTMFRQNQQESKLSGTPEYHIRSIKKLVA